MAAGLGFKTFTTGEVLTAADTNGYLMQGILVFASAAARDSAITSPEEGQFAYLKDTNVTTYYTGSAWANVDTTGMTNPMTTTGDTIYSSSGSTPARLGIGSTGQVLTVAGGLPSWATPAAAGGMTLISETVLSANSGLNLTSIPGTYKQLLLLWFGVKHSANGSTFNLRLNNDSTASIYQHAQWGQTTNTVTNDRGDYSSIGLNGAAPFGDDASEAPIYQSASGEFLIDNYASSTKTKAFFGRWTYKDNAANASMYGQLIGSYNTTTAITSVDVVRMTGTATLTNQTNTSVRLYGIS
jgi:hypothetical protein